MIVSTAPTLIGAAVHGSLNYVKSPTMAAHAVTHAIDRAGMEPGELEDVVLGTVLAGGDWGNLPFVHMPRPVLAVPKLLARAGLKWPDAA